MKHSSNNQLGSIAILTVAFLVSTVVVFADTATTTVTVGNSSPVISSITLNGGNNITLVEGSSVNVKTTIAVSDSNGCSDISSVDAKLFRGPITSAGSSCTADDNNCYQESSVCTATTTGNTCAGGGDTSVEYDCAFTVWYTADPTTAGSAFASDIWVLAATTTDGIDTTTATNTGETIEVNELFAHDVTGSIPFGAVSAGSDTGVTNQTVTVTNTGNTPLDSEISGETMCTDFPTCAGDTLAVTEQKFSLSDVTYASLSNTLALTTATIETVLPKPTATTTPITDDTFWGIAVPGGQAPGSYTGRNTFTAVTD